MWKWIATATAVAASVYTVSTQTGDSDSEEKPFKLHADKHIETADFEKVVNEYNFKFEEHFVTT